MYKHVHSVNVMLTRDVGGGGTSSSMATSTTSASSSVQATSHCSQLQVRGWVGGWYDVMSAAAASANGSRKCSRVCRRRGGAIKVTAGTNSILQTGARRQLLW